MISLNLLFLASFTTIVTGLIWARFRFFKIGPSTHKLAAKLYDPVVIVHIVVSYAHYFNTNLMYSISTGIGLAMLIGSISLFWWSILFSKKMGFASSIVIDKILMTGPYRWVRHPFYLSYILAWLGSSILFNSSLLWITLTYLTVYYFIVAVNEEKTILRSAYSTEYKAYRQNVGMFLPRIKRWKNLNLDKFKK